MNTCHFKGVFQAKKGPPRLERGTNSLDSEDVRGGLYRCIYVSISTVSNVSLMSLSIDMQSVKTLKSMTLALALLALQMTRVSASCAITPDSNGNVEIPASWTTIGYQAFYECSDLTSVTFESGSQLQTIDDYAFKRSGPTSIIIPASVTRSPP